MELSAPHQEALLQLMSLGNGRAAAALAELSGRQLTLEEPQVALHPIQGVRAALREVLPGQVATVHQVFSGPVSGNALLLLEQPAAARLTSLLLQNPTPAGHLRSLERETLTELGNIVLNACLGMFGNLLQVQVTFAVPRFDLDSVDSVLHSLSVRSQELQYALMGQTRFRGRESDLQGDLVIVLGITSFARLLQELARWTQRPVNC